MNTRRLRSIRSFLCVGLAIGLIPAGVLAAGDDPPSRAARLAYVEGSVSFQPGGTEDWVAAPINRPLTTGDQLWSDRDGRAEMQLDGSSVRLSSNTAASFLNLDDAVTQIQLTAGTLIVHVRRLEDDETYEIDTPNLAFSILRPGIYRLSVDASGTTTAIRVRSGQGEVTGGGAAYPVRANEDDIFSGTDRLVESVQPARPELDSFEAWSATRDSRSERAVSARYVSQDVVGYEDLDEQGDWRPSPEFGYVWFPRAVQPGWAPYHDGHWTYIAPWGYTWVDEAPWGFAPFHYGRWAFIGGAWGWVPAPPRAVGVVYVRPVYAPALVAWVGIGSSVAWFALGPREVYVPAYPVSRQYVNRINVSNTVVKTTVINNFYNTTLVNHQTVNGTYVNRNTPGAVTATSVQAFTTAQPVSRNIVRVDARSMAGAEVRSLAPAVVPTKQSVLGSRPAVSVKPPAVVQARTVVARTAPPSPRPRFERQREVLANNGGKPLTTAQVQQIQAREGSRGALVKIAPAAKPVATALGTTVPSSNRAPADTDRARADRPANARAAVGQSAAVAVHPRELPVLPTPAAPATANSALERQHLQQQQALRMQQDSERMKLQRQQELEHQQLKRDQADEQKRQQLELQHRQQTQQLTQRHDQQQQRLREKQQSPDR